MIDEIASTHWSNGPDHTNYRCVTTSHYTPYQIAMVVEVVVVVVVVVVVGADCHIKQRQAAHPPPAGISSLGRHYSIGQRRGGRVRYIYWIYYCRSAIFRKSAFSEPSPRAGRQELRSAGEGFLFFSGERRIFAVAWRARQDSNARL